jgi:HPt (histidine-containing phosphotransfer) domain-containing protein
MPDSTDLDSLCPIDYCEVLDRIGGDIAFLKELLEIYFQEYAEKRQLLEEAISQEDFIRVGELGHSLKGASANLGLARLRLIATALETAARKRQVHLALGAARALDAEVHYLKLFLEGNPPGRYS